MPNSSDCFPNTPNPSGEGTPLTLRLRNLGEICSFKNSKMMTRGRLITDPKLQKRIESYIQSFELQLRSEWQTKGAGMGTGCSLASWIRSVMPLDDSRQWIPEMSLEFVEAEKGQEGADVEITPLP